MKELEKTKRISIVSTLFILVVLIGVLTFERPKNTYAFNTKNTLEKLTTNNYFISLVDTNHEDVVLIDVRSQYEYEKGHLKHALNIASAEILSNENQAILNGIKDSNKTLTIYGKTPEEANISLLILYQLGFSNIKLLPIELDYFQNKLIVNSVEIEKSEHDINSFITESFINVNGPSGIIKSRAAIPKKIITIQKKKKNTIEGGC
jgi:rhodanese-related sulfurtransferase